MDRIKILIELLRAKKDITTLEKDILDTWEELYKVPFDENSAKKQVNSNDRSYPEIFLTIAAMPTTIQRPKSYIPTEADIKYNLHHQLTLLAAKEWNEQNSIN